MRTYVKCRAWRVVDIVRAKHVFKVVFLGEPAVGKTSIVAKHVMSSFKENYIPTLGANITSNDYVVDTYAVTLLIWDIAGQEIFSRVREKYYGGAKAAFVVFDVTRPETVNGARKWVDDIKRFASSSMFFIAIGNKIDLQRKVSAEEGERFAKSINATYIETSARTGERVDEVFKAVTGGSG